MGAGLSAVVCSIGCGDPWNAAGIGLDILALAECGVRAVTIVAGVTAQDRDGVAAVHAVPADVVAAQFHALRHARVAAYRVGALLDVETVDVVAALLATVRVPVVYDPVFAASAGGSFADGAVRAAVRARLLPHVSLVTPNLAEAAALVRSGPVDGVDAMERAAHSLREAGARAVLVKGGHLDGDAVDVFVDENGTIAFAAPRLPGSLRGTGCLLACGIAAALARGETTRDAIATARAFVRAKFASSRATGGMSLAY